MNMHRIKRQYFCRPQTPFGDDWTGKNTGLKNRFEVKKPVKNRFGFLNRFTALLVGLVVKASTSRAEDPGFESSLRRKMFIPVTQKLILQWIPCQAPGVTRLLLALVGPVSVYCDWVRWKVRSATFISVWQHVQLSGQIRPRVTLASCWDVKQPKKQTHAIFYLLRK